MMGVYDFCGHYEWTFTWIESQGGSEFLREYWDKAIHLDSQSHAARLIVKKGIAGMQEYWGHTLAEEGGTHQTTATDKVFRIDMRDCPSKGFLLRNGLKQHSDYCEHCIGWVGPLLKRAGFVVDHQHNHCGQCWWEFRRATDPSPPSRPGELGPHDIRLQPEWQPKSQSIDSYSRANGPEQKSRSSGPDS